MVRYPHPHHLCGQLLILLPSLWPLLRLLIIGTLALYGLALSTQGNGRPVPSRPNIVLIVADDMGYNDLGCYGAPEIHSPNLDGIASAGIRFTGFYVSQAVCSASRASILTGCYANRVGILGALMPNSLTGISRDETTLAELLKEQGYHTACIGKWHLGDRKEFLPTRHGFDSYFGIPYSNDMWPMHPQKQHFPPLPVYENTKVWTTLEEQSQVTTLYTERAVGFIRKHNARPFFLYLAYNMPHVPLFVSEKFKGRSEQGLYGDVIMEIDWSVGEILKALREEGLSENTLVIFTSDNGPWLSYGTHAGSAFPLREGKGTAWDGGQRVPALMLWPGVIPASTTCSEPVMTIDLFPTIAAITGASLPSLKIDGENILPLMTGRLGAVSPHKALCFYYGRQLNCLRSGPWKLHLPHGYQTLNGRKGRSDGIPIPYEQAFTDWALFNMEQDPEEMVNRFDTRPDVAGRLKEYADMMIHQLGDAGQAGTENRPPGYAKGYSTGPGQVKNMAVGATIEMKGEFTGYTRGGVRALTDGVTGSPLFHDGAWMGFQGDDLDALVCFDRDTLVRQIHVRFLVDRQSWIFEPTLVFLMIPGIDDVERLIYLEKERPRGTQEPAIVTYSATLRKRITCFQIRAINRGICPAGHQGEGKKAWIFADEIVAQ